MYAVGERQLLLFEPTCAGKVGKDATVRTRMYVAMYVLIVEPAAARLPHV